MSGKSNFLTKHLRQSAVWWANPVNDGEGGRTFDAPAEILVRWENKLEVFIDAQGREARSRAIVFVDCDMRAGEYLFLGAESDLNDETDPLKIGDAFEIRAVEKIPDIKAERFLRKIYV